MILNFRVYVYNIYIYTDMLLCTIQHCFECTVLNP